MGIKICQTQSLIFMYLDLKVMLGIKYPPVEVRDGSDPPGIQLTFDLRQRLFKPPRWSSLRHTPKFCWRAGPRQRRYDSSRRPDSYGSRTSSPTPIPGKLHPDSYGSWTSPLTLIAGGLHPDPYRGRTSSPTLVTGRLRPDSYGSRAPEPHQERRKKSHSKKKKGKGERS